MHRILVPTDFSPNAVKAIDYAVQIAKLNGAQLYIVHAVDLMDTTFRDRLEIKEEYNKTVSDEAFSKLDILKQSIEESEGVTVETKLYNGPVGDTILLSSQEIAADLVIMGTMGITGLKEAIFGSKTAAIVGRSSVPVLAIPLEYEWNKPSKFVLAVNHFDEAPTVVAPVFRLATVFKASVELVVFTDDNENDSALLMERTRAVRKLQESLIAQYPQVIVSREQILGHHFEATINDFIQANAIDLLAMITHHRSIVESIFHRSITRKMAHHTKVPLLSIPVPPTS